MSGAGARTEPGVLCPEYVLMGDTVVYVIIGKSSEQLLPLAEVTRFRFRKNKMLIRVDDAAKESRFHIKAMALRPIATSRSKRPKQWQQLAIIETTL